jgi:hypothetical protein
MIVPVLVLRNWQLEVPLRSRYRYSRLRQLEKPSLLLPLCENILSLEGLLLSVFRFLPQFFSILPFRFRFGYDRLWVCSLQYNEKQL